MDIKISKYTGFTLLEVLIAMVIISVGLLGVVNLQIKGLRYTQDAYFRSQVIVLAQDLADRMRANSTGVIAGLYSNISSTPSTYTDCAITECTAAQLAQYDIYFWRTRIAAELPFGEGMTDVCNISATCTITITWKARDIGIKDAWQQDYNSLDTLASLLTFMIRLQDMTL